MNSFVRFVLTRLGSALVTLLGVSLVIFTAIRMVPGKFEEVLMPRGTPEFRAALAERLGLDQPVYLQYGKWVNNLVHGDFGLSLVTGAPVWDEFSQRLPVTMELATGAVLLALLVGVPLGIFTGLAQRKPWILTFNRLFAGFTISTPDFVLGSIFLYVFSRYSIGLTVGNWINAGDDLVAHLRGVVVPIVTLSIFGIGVIAATTRYSVLAVMRQDHVTAASLRGRSWHQVVNRHIIRNASIPVLTILSIYLGNLLGGTVLIEYLYSVPGFGRYLFQGIQSRDYPVVQAGVMLAASFFILLNMLTDIAYAWLDPRMRGGEHS